MWHAYSTCNVLYIYCVMDQDGTYVHYNWTGAPTYSILSTCSSNKSTTWILSRSVRELLYNLGYRFAVYLLYSLMYCNLTITTSGSRLLKQCVSEISHFGGLFSQLKFWMWSTIMVAPRKTKTDFILDMLWINTKLRQIDDAH